jgi:hypothetical protein
MVLRNVNTGEFEVYDIVNNQITTANSLGSVGLDWSVGGFAADPPTGNSGDVNSCKRWLVLSGMQPMIPIASSLGDDTPQQTLLTTPQHA